MMIVAIEGILSEVDYNTIVIFTNGGISYEIEMVYSGIFKFNNSTIGKTIQVFSSQIISEEKIHLYGFITNKERKMFDRLLSISGIGVHIAKILINNLGEKHIALYSKQKLSENFTKINGIGKKTAELIIENFNK